MANATPRLVLVTRRTPLEELLARHATRGQAATFVAQRGLKIEVLEERHARTHAAERQVGALAPGDWRRASVEREQLDRFLFEEQDIVVAVGQDGLVANLAKYLAGQPVIGLNPLPELYDGVLVKHAVEAAPRLLAAAADGKAKVERRTMVEARLDDGQRLLALNEVFVGHRSHQSARYRLRWQGKEERHSSSGVIIASGTGCTGWARSICLERGDHPAVPQPADPALLFLVREAFPSGVTGTDLTAGLLAGNETLEIVSEMETGGLAFGDGIEQDWIEFAWGQRLTLARAAETLNLVL